MRLDGATYEEVARAGGGIVSSVRALRAAGEDALFAQSLPRLDALIAAGATTRDHLPTWVIVSCYAAISIGTLFGGWRIVKTMGQRITKLRPVGGFAAESAGAMTLFGASAFGIPVSTTHTITGAIVGVGMAQRTSAVRWGIAGTIVLAWVLTIPAAAFFAACAWWIGMRVFCRERARAACLRSARGAAHAPRS